MTASILYVDDEPALCRAFERALRAPGVKIVTMPSAETALSILGREHFDVVASDLRLPDGNGIEILLESRRRCPTARRLLVSGRIDGVLDPQDLTAADVDNVVMKPWTLDELRRVVRGAVERAIMSRELEEIRVRMAALTLSDPEAALRSQRVARIAHVVAARLGKRDDDALGLVAAYDVLRTRQGLGHDEAMLSLRHHAGLDVAEDMVEVLRQLEVA